MYLYSERKFRRILKDNGYAIDRHSGDHIIWTNKEGDHITTVYPETNALIMRRIIRDHDLKVN